MALFYIFNVSIYFKTFLSAERITSIGQIIKSACLCESQSHKTSWTLCRSQSSADLHQTCHHGSVPGDVVIYRCGLSMEIQNISVRKWWVIRCRTHRRSDRTLTMAFDWHYELWHWMTLKCFSSRSLKLHVKYCENSNRYDDGVNWGRIGNHSWAIDWHRDLWLWMTLYCPWSRSQVFIVKYLEYGIMVYGMEYKQHP